MFSWAMNCHEQLCFGLEGFEEEPELSSRQPVLTEHQLHSANISDMIATETTFDMGSPAVDVGMGMFGQI